MLTSLSIQNYAIIKDLQINFASGLSIITGETGAGKSILLGALSLLIGQRADSDILYDKSRKCIVEGLFYTKGYGLEDLFEQYELDADISTLVRREINTDGKSRAFINDTPVNVSVLKEFGERLIDIHSQHQNLYMENPLFQLKVIDTFARQTEIIQNYKEKYTKYKSMLAAYQKMYDEYTRNNANLEYLQFQYKQLLEAKLQEGEQEQLEEELQTLTHAEEIKSYLAMVSNSIGGEENSALLLAKESVQNINKLRSVFSPAENISSRLDSVIIELKDILNEVERYFEKIEFNPKRAEFVKQRIDLIYSLQQKHHVNSIPELNAIKEDTKSKIDIIDNADTHLNELKIEVDRLKSNLENIGSEISRNRNEVAPHIEEKIKELLGQLGMPNSSFKINLAPLNELTSTGCDKITFLFSANKQAPLQELSKVASGGEMARLMLSIKAVIAESILLPTIIFDEIDQGVSGEIADKMGNMIMKMSEFAQIINITHLPQIASKGKNHFLVYKEDQENRTLTMIKHLKAEERVIEIARMLSGEELSEAAINNAKALLGMN